MGFLSDTTTMIRQFVDEPEASVKFSDATIRTYIRLAWNDVLGELNKVSDAKIRVRHDITIVADQAEYELPPTIAEILYFEKIDSASGRPVEEIIPNHPLSPSGPGFTIEGPMLRLDPVWKRGDTFRLTYVPNGEVAVYEGTVSAGTTTTLTLPTTGTGTIDYRPQAYSGYICRLTGATYSAGTPVQERVITGYNNVTRVITVAPAWSPVPSNYTTGTFELLPFHIYQCQGIIAMRVATMIAAMTGDVNRERALNSEYHRLLRTVRMNLARMNTRNPKIFQRSVRNKPMRGGW